MIIALIVGFLLALTVIIIWLNYYLEARRRNAMSRVAARLGFEFLGPRFLKSLREGYPTRLVRGRLRITNVMTGQALGATLAIFDAISAGWLAATIVTLFGAMTSAVR